MSPNKFWIGFFYLQFINIGSMDSLVLFLPLKDLGRDDDSKVTEIEKIVHARVLYLRTYFASSLSNAWALTWKKALKGIFLFSRKA